MEVKPLKDLVDQLMRKNQRNVDGNFYTIPAETTYPHQWFWDSCFHSIIYTKLGQVDNAKNEIFSLLKKQHKNGLIPHIIYWDKNRGDFPEIDWGREDTSTITQPPMIAYVVWEIYMQDRDKKFLRAVYRSLERYYGYILEDRDPEKSGLVSIVNPDESGEDNSPRFDRLMQLNPQQTLDENFQKRLFFVKSFKESHFNMKKALAEFDVKDVPFNTILLENVRILAKIAKEIGEKDDAVFYEGRAEFLALSMRKYMFEDGLFLSVSGKTQEKILTKTWALFIPLFAKLYTKQEAEIVIRTFLLREKEFNNRKYFLPTVSFEDDSYNPTSLWRGPIWMNVNWFIYKGLLKYRKINEAKRIRNSTFSLISQSGFREYYHPETGKGLGAKNFTWGGLILDMYY